MDLPEEVLDDIPSRVGKRRVWRGMDLPEEMLDDILGRVPPRHLAACRRVCRDWRAAIDGRGLVPAHLAPRPVRGIFISFTLRRNRFFSRAATGGPTSSCSAGIIDHAFRFLRGHDYWDGPSHVLDHCNGFLLCQTGESTFVCNPVTRRWAAVAPPLTTPPPAPIDVYDRERVHLVFDPTVSLHYDVLFFPAAVTSRLLTMPPPAELRRIEQDYGHERNTAVGQMEWPPHSYAVHVFSSRTGQWEERRFAREGNAVVTVRDVWSDLSTLWLRLRRHAVYWNKALYLHCRGGFVMRLSLLGNKYLVIKTPTLHDTSLGLMSQPTPDNTDEYKVRRIIHRAYLGKPKQGIYYTAIHKYHLQTWAMREEAWEPRQTPEWEPRHQTDLRPSFLRHYSRKKVADDGSSSWILDPRDQEGSADGEDHGQWDSDDDDDDDSMVTDVEEGINTSNIINRINKNLKYNLWFLGHHPSKEIVFLGHGHGGFAYYLGSSKLQYIGSLSSLLGSSATVVYTPCMEDLFPARNDP